LKFTLELGFKVSPIKIRAATKKQRKGIQGGGVVLNFGKLAGGISSTLRIGKRNDFSFTRTSHQSKTPRAAKSDVKRKLLVHEILRFSIDCYFLVK